MPRNASDEPGNDAKTGRSTLVPAVAKALDLFEALAESPRGLTMAQLVETTGRTMGEIYRIVIYLAERGYLEKHPDTDRYVLTLRLFQLASVNAPSGQLVRRAIPILESIAQRTEQSCHIASLSNGEVVVLATEPSPRHAGYSVRAGASLPIGSTSSGLIILAFSSEDVRDRHLASLVPSERQEWQVRIEAIRACGHEQRDSVLVQGVRNISVPVFDHRGIVAAITMGFIGQIKQRAGVSEALRELESGAQRLSRQLGSQGASEVPVPR